MTEWDVNESGDFDDLEMTSDDVGAIMAMVAEIDDQDRHRIEPPPSIWNAIADTVVADRNGQPNRSLVLVEDGSGSVVADIATVEQQATTTISLAARGRDSSEPMLPSDSGAWRRQWLPVAAAVAIAIVGGLVTWAFSEEISSDDVADGTGEPAGELVAATEITNEGLSVPAVESAEASLVRVDDQYYLDVDVPDLPSVEGYYEVWIIDTDVEGMFSLGVVTGDGRFALPGNVDPADYPVVDVSVEPVDGDPTHSGQSIWRGVLDPADS